jgi:hypothetical protein
MHKEHYRSFPILSAPTGRAPSGKMLWNALSIVIDIIEGYNSRILDDWENAMAWETSLSRVRCAHLVRIGQDICQH